MPWTGLRRMGPILTALVLVSVCVGGSAMSRLLQDAGEPEEEFLLEWGKKLYHRAGCELFEGGDKFHERGARDFGFRPCQSCLPQEPATEPDAAPAEEAEALPASADNPDVSASESQPAESPPPSAPSPEKHPPLLGAPSQQSQDLIKAAIAGESERVRALLQEGAEVDTRDGNGMTALMWASFEGHTETVQVLLGSGADRTLRDRSGTTALTWGRSHPEIVSVLERSAALSMVSLDGDDLTLESFRGKVVLLDFWATWCGPCVAAVPELKRLSRRMDESPFVLLSISSEKRDVIEEFVARQGMRWPQIHDEGDRLHRHFKVRGLPTYVLIDHEGNVVYETMGWSTQRKRTVSSEVAKAIKAARNASKQSQPFAPAQGR